MSMSLRRHFIKDNRIPIQVVSDTEFTYFMDLYDPLYGCWDAYRLFMDTVHRCGGESEYFKEVSNFVDRMVGAITETESYAMLCATQSVSNYEMITKPVNKNIYHTDFVDRQMISIDISSANFNALRSFDPSAVLNCESYTDLSRQFTEYEYIATNKQIRQVVFGKTAPTKLQQIQKATMAMLCDSILMSYPEFKISMVGSDELIVYEYGEYSVTEAYILINSIVLPVVDYVRCEAFTLTHVHPERHYFARQKLLLAIESDFETDTTIVKFNGYGKPEFKMIPTLFFAQVYKNYIGLPITADDLIFLHEGLVARFEKTIFE